MHRGDVPKDRRAPRELLGRFLKQLGRFLDAIVFVQVEQHVESALADAVEDAKGSL